MPVIVPPIRKGICRFIAVLVLTSICCIDQHNKLTTNKPQVYKSLKPLRTNTGGTKWPHLYYNLKLFTLVIFLYFVRCCPYMLLDAHTRAHRLDPKIRNCISELESLAIQPKRLNELNDVYEMERLVDNLKLNLFADYQSEESKFLA